jgi:hypothetical protein
MNITDIDKLKRSSKNENLYDLTKLTYRTSFGDVSYGEYRVQKGEEMRIDLVCQSIYGNVDYVDKILNANNISNPLNIKEGVLLKYPLVDFIEQTEVTESLTNDVQAALANPSKSKAPDPSRQAYVEQNYSLPPTVMEQPTRQIVVENGVAKVGNGLFNK